MTADTQGVFDRCATTMVSVMNTVFDTFDECARQESATTLTDECVLVGLWRSLDARALARVDIALFAQTSATLVEHIEHEHTHHHERADRAGAFVGSYRHIEDQINACLAEVAEVAS